MKNPILAILFLSLFAGSMSCSYDSNNSGGGGTQAGTSSQGGSASVGSSSSAGASSSKASGGDSGSAGSSASGGQSSAGGSSDSQTSSGGKTSTGGSKTGGSTGTAGTTGNGGQSSATSSAVGGTQTGGTSETGGVTVTGGQTSAGGRTTGPRTGGSSGGGTSATTGSTGGSASGGSSSTDTAPKGGSVSSPGCGKTPTLTSGAQKIGSRNYMLRIPTGYDNKHPYPMVFGFHWNGGTMNDVDGGGSSGYTWSYFGLREKADNSTDKKMIFVAPDGNGGWPNSGGQDLKFVDDMYKTLTEDLCVDTTRVFSMGFSYGGGMSYEIACARASTFRAVAVYSGAQLSGCDGGKDPIAYIGFHSVTDGTCNYSGGEGLRNKFVTNNSCTAMTPPKPSTSTTHVCTSYTGCKAGYPVRWCAFDGGGHSPAPVDGNSNGSGGGDKTWTKDEAWAFFTQF